jgi:hypothetical protein
MSPAEIARARTAKVRARTVASLGDGGLLSWKSSPHVMWLGWQLQEAAHG